MSATRGKALARRRRSLAAADDVGGIVGDTIDQIGRQAQQMFRERAGQEMQGRRFADGPPVPTVDITGLFDQAAWQASLLEAEGYIGEFIIDETRRAGLQARIQQPFVQELLAVHLSQIEAYGLDAEAHIGASLTESFRKGHSVDRAAKALVGGDMRPRAAELIARTELVSVGNGAAMVSAKAAGVPGDMKVWLATPDTRTRPTHADADGQSVPLDQPFTVGGEDAEYPGDPGLSLDGRGNCRCSFYVVQA